MALRNLLVHIDATRGSEKCTDAALALARAHEAHLAGVYCVAGFPATGWPYMAVQMADEQRRLDEERAADAVRRFRDAAEHAGVSYGTRTAHTPADLVADEIAVHARYADLAIMGQVDPDDPPPGGRGLVEQVVVGCGRPVLVVPYIGAPKHGADTVFGRNVMVAWDAGREAARAVNDALPVLERAAHVDVIVVNPVKSATRHGPEPGADIAAHLARHGIDVDVDHFDARDIGVGDMILARLADRGSDMLVMGAYAHARLRELVTGGVTRSVLEQMTVPVLMSH